MLRTVHTPDGRVLAVEEGGDPAGRPVLTHMSTPMPRGLYGPHSRDAAERGLRPISYDRPGYGGSSPHPGRSVADCAGDVRAICAQLGIERLAMWGISGGGPHVRACAALLPDLVAAAASLASPAPFDAEGLDYFAGTGQGNVDGIACTSPTSPRPGRKRTRIARTCLPHRRTIWPRIWSSVLSPADAAVLTDELAEFLTTSMKEALAPGSQGWWDDNSYLRPWGFELADIAVPVLLLQGKHDLMVPFSHGE